MTRILPYLLSAAIAVGALITALRVPHAPSRIGALALVLLLVAVAAALQALLGPVAGPLGRLVRAGGFAVVAAGVLGAVEALREAEHPDGFQPAVVVVWIVILGLHLLAICVLTGTRPGVAGPALAAGAGFGLAGFLLWALLCLMQPELPSYNAPTVLTLALASVAAIQWSAQRGAQPRQNVVAGLTAAGAVTLMSVVYIDACLRFIPRWAAHNAPPLPYTPYRMVDPVGILILSTVVVIVLLGVVLVGRRRTIGVAAAGS